MQPQMGMMLQPFMFDMNAMMKMGQMNQLQGMDMAQIGFNPMMMGMGMGIPINNNAQQQINENANKQNEEKNE